MFVIVWSKTTVLIICPCSAWITKKTKLSPVSVSNSVLIEPHSSIRQILFCQRFWLIVWNLIQKEIFQLFVSSIFEMDSQHQKNRLIDIKKQLGLDRSEAYTGTTRTLLKHVYVHVYNVSCDYLQVVHVQYIFLLQHVHNHTLS